METRPASPAPVWARILMGLVVTALLLLTLEGLLALTGIRPILYADDPYVGFSGRVPLFVEETGPDGGSWYVTAPNQLRRFNPQRFARSKPDDTVRIFCLGGSTTYGRPYLDATSFPGWMRAYLPGLDPDRKWEVVNAGGVSYASYRVAAVMEELLDYEPDLFVIYTGHNEFLERRTYGDLMETPALVRTVGSWASGTRIHAALSRALGRRVATPGSGPQQELPAEVETILADAVGPRDYYRDDEHRARVVEHYRLNLERMVDMARSVGADVVFVTPASNLAACSPFKSTPGAGLPVEVAREADQWLAPAREALASGDPAAALPAAARAVDLDPRSAEAQWLHGRALAALGNWEAAAAAFGRARDEDVCPLRAPREILELCRTVAREREVPLVDFERLVADWSEDGVPGDDWFLDHVHPTIEGNRRLALEILATLRERGWLPDREFDPAHLEAVTASVMEGIDLRTHGIALRNLAKVLRWAGKVEEAEALAMRALALVPDDPEALLHMGLAARAQGRAAEAVNYLRDALRQNPGLSAGRLELGLALRDLGRLDEAVTVLEQALRDREDDVRVYNNLGLVLADSGRYPEAVDVYLRGLALDPGYTKAHNNLGNAYLAQDRFPEAIAAFQAALELDPDYVLVRANLGLALARSGRLAEAETEYRAVLGRDPAHVDAHFGLGLLAGQRGREAEARTRFERVLELDPEHARARSLLDRLGP